MPRWSHVGPVPLVFTAALFVFTLWAGCSKKPTGLDGGHWNEAPETGLTYAPLEADTTSFTVHLYWNRHDNYGEGVRFRYAIDPYTMNNPAQWPPTKGND